MVAAKKNTEIYRGVLLTMQNLVRSSNYVITLHADEEMWNDKFTLDDVLHCILEGQMTSVQQDVDTEELKYQIHGVSTDERDMEIVAKIGPTGKLVIITVYAIY